jgi:hypothetical protein
LKDKESIWNTQTPISFTDPILWNYHFFKANNPKILTLIPNPLTLNPRSPLHNYCTQKQHLIASCSQNFLVFSASSGKYFCPLSNTTPFLIPASRPWESHGRDHNMILLSLLMFVMNIPRIKSQKHETPSLLLLHSWAGPAQSNNPK